MSYETPWKVIGFEKFVSEAGDDCVRLHCIRPGVPGREGNIFEGTEVKSIFYKTKYVKHDPQLFQLIIATPGRYDGTVGQIVVLGYDGPQPAPQQ